MQYYFKEVPENGSDITHLNHLHTSPVITGADLRYNFLDWCQVVAHHSWSAQWEPLEDEKHVGQLQLTHSFVLFGWPDREVYNCYERAVFCA